LPFRNCIYKSLNLTLDLLFSLAHAPKFSVEPFMTLAQRLFHSSYGVVDHFDAQNRVRKPFEQALLQLVSAYQRRILAHSIATLMMH